MELSLVSVRTIPRRNAERRVCVGVCIGIRTISWPPVTRLESVNWINVRWTPGSSFDVSHLPLPSLPFAILSFFEPGFETDSLPPSLPLFPPFLSHSFPHFCSCPYSGLIGKTIICSVKMNLLDNLYIFFNFIAQATRKIARCCARSNLWDLDLWIFLLIVQILILIYMFSWELNSFYQVRSQDTFAVFINLIICERTYIAYFKCTTFLILVKLIFPSLIRLSNFHILSLNYEISIFTIKLSYRIEKMKTWKQY